jgi:hypothetical protein
MLNAIESASENGEVKSFISLVVSFARDQQNASWGVFDKS